MSAPIRRLEWQIEADLFDYYKAQPYTLSVTSQMRLRGFGIPDLVVETYRGEDEPVLTTVIECKAVTAGIRVLYQLNVYLAGLRYYDRIGGVESVVVGCIAAPRFSRDLLNYEAEAELRGELFYLQVAA